MELDDYMKQKTNNISDGSKTEMKDETNFSQILDSIANHFKIQRKKTIIWITILLMLCVIYISISTLSESSARTGYQLIILGFILGAVYLYFKIKPIPGLFYTLPVTDFINITEKRLKFMNFIDWLIVIPILLILGTGGGIIFITRLLNYTDDRMLLLIIWIVFYLSVITFGFYASKKNWLKENGALLDEIKRFKELI